MNSQCRCQHCNRRTIRNGCVPEKRNHFIHRAAGSESHSQSKRGKTHAPVSADQSDRRNVSGAVFKSASWRRSGKRGDRPSMEAAFTSWRRRRYHQPLQEEEGDSPAAGVLRKKPSSSSLNTLRRSLRKRLPLQRVDFNSDHTPTWDSLKPGALQTLGRSARNTWGSVARKLDKRRQSRSDFLVITPSKSATPRPRASGSATMKRTSPRTPRGREWGPHHTPPSGKPNSRNSKAQWKEDAHLLDKDVLPLRRSVRSATLRSPYGSPRRIIRQRQFDRDLESVSFGIGQLKRLSQDFEKTVPKGESVIFSLIDD
ncbi:protein PIMREG-like isoform X2 [Narcine bancroftii]|uniref:protein PIMREG-like isoform X2 n=1 Tax=Narcine bancroftii TaxID=1343680 RepID=UPI0038312ACA